jgi:WD repeat-containing protein 48
MESKTSRAEYEDRELASDAVPLLSEPDEVLQGERGLLRSIILNDRMHALTVDTAGEVAVWDIIRGVCLGRWAPADVAAASMTSSAPSTSSDAPSSRERSPREALEAVRERVEGEAFVSQWSSADTKTGLLSVHVGEKCFEAEVYADEAGFGVEKQFGDETRCECSYYPLRWKCIAYAEFAVNIGKWVLRNLFLGFVREEQRTRKRKDSTGPPLSAGANKRAHPHIQIAPAPSMSRSISASSTRSDRSSIVVMSPTMLPAMSPAIQAQPRATPLLQPMVPLKTKDNTMPLPAIPQSPTSPAAHHEGKTPMPRNATAPGAIPNSKEGDYFSVPTRTSMGAPPTPDDFSGWQGPASARPEGATSGAVPATPQTPGGGFMNRFKWGKGVKKQGQETPAPTAPAAIAETVEPAEAAPPVLTPAQAILQQSALNPPSSSELPTVTLPPTMTVLISEEDGAGWTAVYRGVAARTGEDLDALEQELPSWLADFLLVNKVPPVPVAKISFVLLPYPARDGQDQLPELLNTAQSKLTASRFLRVRKLTGHVRFSSHRVSLDDHY